MADFTSTCSSFCSRDGDCGAKAVASAQPRGPERAVGRAAQRARHLAQLLLLGLASFALPHCKSGSSPEPAPQEKKQAATAASASAALASAKAQASTQAAAPRPQRQVKAKPVASVPPTADDPLKGVYSLELATKDLPGEGPLVAELDTTEGKLSCELWPAKAPLTVANFIGLARGTRPWKSVQGKWETKPLYDGTVFHRVIKGFMLQGGDPAGNGSGGPGYSIPDEVWENGSHNERGLLCMANRGPNTNGSQFFILDKPALHLDGGYTIFGKCGPDEVIEKIAATPVRGDRALSPPKINKVTVTRGAAK